MSEKASLSVAPVLEKEKSVYGRKKSTIERHKASKHRDLVLCTVIYVLCVIIEMDNFRISFDNPINQ